MEISAGTIIAVALTAAFTAWAGVVAFIGKRFLAGLAEATAEMRLIRGDLKNEAEKLNEYIIQTESRLAVLEDRIVNHGP